MSRIRNADVELVKERVAIDEVIRDYVTLRTAGAGSLKGLCPFHDERSPSFTVSPARGMFHCFGCQESGDAISFLQKLEGLSFVEVIEKLAARYHIPLHYEETSPAADKAASVRGRLVEAHRIATAFYINQLSSPEAEIGRNFLIARGFDPGAAAHFSVGYSPKSWDALAKHLSAAGFSEAELLAAGLLTNGDRGNYDRFRGRLMWPIRDLSGDVVGFGARKLYEDDGGPKYLNTPETPIYKKSQVLYGLDLARRDIAKSQTAVIVEGYTDVMACHLSGVTTAVATCGTAFGVEHIKILRRLLLDNDQSNGQVIFTFDGDAAGQKAALKAFAEDQRFVAQTFVAVEPNGLDPCDLYQKHGPNSVAALIQTRRPMFEFVIRSKIAEFDLSTAEGRTSALKATAPIVANIKDPTLRPEYTRLLAGWIGVDLAISKNLVQQALKTPKAIPAPQVLNESPAEPVVVPTAQVPPPDPKSLEHRVEREALKVALQHPEFAGDWYASVERSAFTYPTYARMHEVLEAVFLVVDVASISALEWSEMIIEMAEADLKSKFSAALNDPLQIRADDSLERYVTSVIAKLLELDASRQIAEQKSQLQRIDPADLAGTETVMRRLMALESQRRALNEHARGIS